MKRNPILMIRLKKTKRLFEKCQLSSHPFPDEIVKEDLPLSLPGVGGQGKTIKGAHVHVNLRPVEGGGGEIVRG